VGVHCPVDVRFEGRDRTFLVDYTYAGKSSEVKCQIVDMAMSFGVDPRGDAILGTWIDNLSSG
jgi:hypothetical protein